MADRFRGQKKAKLWSFIPSIGLTFSANGTQGAASLSFTSPQTVIRMLGEYTIGAHAAITALDEAVLVVAIGKVSTDAFVLGSTALPDPGAEPEYPWLYWASHPLYFPTSSLEGQVTSGVRHTFDIRSMRKFTARESLAMVVQYVDAVGAPELRLNVGHIRVLATLH